MRGKVLALFLLPLFICAGAEQGKNIEGRFLKIEKASTRKIKIFQKKESFTQDELNSFIAYKLKNAEEGNAIDIKEANLSIGKKDFSLRMIGVMNRPLPLLDMEAANLRILPLSMKFTIEQKSYKYRIRLTEFKIGNAVPSGKLVLIILQRLKESTGLNFDLKNWGRFPYGIRKFKQKKEKITVYY